MLVATVVPWTMFFSYFILKARYTYNQVLVALMILVYSVMYTIIDRNNFFLEGGNKLYGSLLALASAIIYGFNCTLIEKFAVDITPMAYLCRECLGGLIVAIIVMFAAEFPILKQTRWEVFLLGIPYAALFALYMFIAIFLTIHGSAVVNNLSSQSTNIYSFIINIFIFKTAYLWT